MLLTSAVSTISLTNQWITAFSCWEQLKSEHLYCNKVKFWNYPYPPAIGMHYFIFIFIFCLTGHLPFFKILESIWIFCNWLGFKLRKQQKLNTLLLVCILGPLCTKSNPIYIHKDMFPVWLVYPSIHLPSPPSHLSKVISCYITSAGDVIFLQAWTVLSKRKALFTFGVDKDWIKMV
jgi:hypothetical protein